MDKKIAVGIDLGTTFSCIAVYRNGEAEVIQNKSGNNITPSVVAFKSKSDTFKNAKANVAPRCGEILVGEAARNQAHRNVKNTLYEVKRLIGRSINDPQIQDDLKRFPFEATNLHGKIGIKAKVNGEDRICSCEEISFHVLKELKTCAEDYLQCSVKEAVISVPAYFNNAQREATLEAARLAELEVLRLIDEPTAGALTYGMQLEKSSFRNVLVFDLGGGTFDVSVLKVYGSSDFEVRAIGGDTHLGGEDFDTHLVEFCLKEFNDESKGAEYSDRALYKLRDECEKTKRMLSTSFTQTVEVPSFYGDEDLIVEVNRVDFEKANQTFFHKTIKVMKDVLEGKNIEKSEIDDIVLVGGSCRIPKIQELVENFFGKKPHVLSTANMSLDTAVACGAAILAAHKLGTLRETGICLKEVSPRSIGVGMLFDRMHFFLKRNDIIPCERFHVFGTVRDFQDTVEIEVFEGESYDASENDWLGHFKLCNITKAPAGETPIEVKFVVDENRILKVTAAEKGKNREESLEITKSCLTGKKADYEERPYGRGHSGKGPPPNFLVAALLHELMSQSGG